MNLPLKLAATYLATGAAFAAVDAIWLTRMGPGLYRPTLDPLLADQPRLGVAVIFYLAYVAGIVALAIWPNRGAPVLQTAITGAMLGAMAYATYDLTNQATLKVWATKITVLDIGWGTFLTAAAATAGGLVLQRLK